ncbi:glycosyltransferase family 32 protein [Gonapodya prolifera JEL478]|uniref:Glycosyltransferase family 32 protein n=1 Tax=Gonapodya prolifera (strain JEL478) TaxID=1344416 RepID=A0A138ZZF1_GONPJ|nr:glycosyltransferase family 32 protein [Gonapodya prolifera JEL478]|eukprot:KXS09870.1 glycosyltransferase family 32 protein [Gonapodya prolifera JEL478]
MSSPGRFSKAFYLIAAGLIVLGLLEFTGFRSTLPNRRGIVSENQIAVDSRDELAPPPLIIQSWKTSSLPQKFQRWSESWRLRNPSYGYLLSTDASNRLLVAQHFPSFLPVYDAFDREIYRADSVRYVYMYALGGMYADLDTVSLKPLDSLWKRYSKASPGVFGQAYLGRMGNDEDFGHGLPNAWMASTPGHPLWLFVLKRIFDVEVSKLALVRPEEQTGPMALFNAVQDFKAWSRSPSPSTSISIGGRTFPLPSPGQHVLQILPTPIVYPLDWRAFFDHPDDKGIAACHAKYDGFNETMCNERLKLSESDAFVMTYWSATWDGVNEKSLGKQ